MNLSRRGFLGFAGAMAGSSLLGFGPARRSLRIAFVTDLHLPALGLVARASRMFRQVAAEKPDLVLFGGDNVMSVDHGAKREDADAQFSGFVHLRDLFVKAPHLSIIGNHDIWWNKEHPDLAKGLALEAFKMPSRYYRDEAGGWTILMLDVFHADGCRVDPEQLEWLKKQLKDGSGPLLVASHAPILSVSHFHEIGAPKNGSWSVPVGWQVGNAIEIHDLLRACGRRTLCLSGHMHHVDYVEYHDVRYLCGGAASGAWWGGRYHDFPPAYVVLDIQPDGSCARRTVFWEKGA